MSKMSIIEKFEKEQMKELLGEKKTVPDFIAGDTVKVSVKIKDGNVERVQAYEGVVISKKNRALTSSFIVRKISHTVGVERSFMIYSPLIQSIEVVRRGDVRRAKLYYLRDRQGKAARIKEKRGRKAVIKS